MTQDEIHGFAKQAGFPIQHHEWRKAAEEFAALVEAKATERANERSNASWALMSKKMVEAEREACAKVCEEGIANADDWNSAHWDQACENRAWAIRARGQAWK